MGFVEDDGLVYTGSQLIIPGYWNPRPPRHTKAGLKKLLANYTCTPNLLFSAPGHLLLSGISSESFGKVAALLAFVWVFSEQLSMLRA